MADTAEPSYFVKNLVGLLLPHFMAYTFESGALHADVRATLASSGARTRLELLHAALAIAFGFSALETLAESRNAGQLTPAAHARYKACAASLNRACQQNIRALNACLACDMPAAKLAKVPPNEPVNDLSDQDAVQQIRQAQATMEACRKRLTQPGSQPAARRTRDNPLSHLFAPPTPQAAPR